MPSDNIYIESTDHLKPWLVRELTPISDADPQPLAKYVIALLKKDQKGSMKDVCAEQLEVFLGKDTMPFVAKLFETLKNGSYLPDDYKFTKEKKSKSKDKKSKDKKADKESKSHRSSEKASKKREETLKASEEETFEKPEPKLEEPKPKIVPVKQVQPVPPTESTLTSKSKTMVKPDSPKRRNRSRSPIQISAPLTRASVRDRLGPSNRERTGALPVRRHITIDNNEAHHIKRTIQNEVSPEKKGVTDARQLIRHVINDLPSSGERKRILQAKQRKMEELETPDESENDYDDNEGALVVAPVLSEKRVRCTDFDSKGFCALGSECQFDHGTNVVVVKDLQDLVRAQRQLNRTNKFESLSPLQGGASDAGPDGDVPPPPGMEGIITRKRKLVNTVIQPQSNNSNLIDVSQPPPALPAHFSKYTGPAYVDPRQVSANLVTNYTTGTFNAANKRNALADNRSTILVTCLPKELNTIGQLDSYFKKFGDISQINVRLNNRDDIALVSFIDKSSAHAALASPQAVLDNRFIRMTMYDPNRDVSDGPRAKLQKLKEVQSVRFTQRGGLSKTFNNPGAYPRGSRPFPVPDRQAKSIPIRKPFVVKQENSSKQEYFRLAKRLKQREETRKTSKLLIVKSQEFLDQYLTQYKKVVEKLATSINNDLIAELKKMARELEEKIDETKKDIEKNSLLITKLTELDDGDKKSIKKLDSKPKIEPASIDVSEAAQGVSVKTGSSQPTAPADKAKQELSGRLSELQNEISALQNRSKVPFSRGRGGIRGRGRGRAGYRLAAPSVSRLDKRTKKILVTGFLCDDRDAIIKHLQNFGKCSLLNFDEKGGQLRAHFEFDQRQDAEQAIELGKFFNDKEIVITWDVAGASGIERHSSIDRNLSASEIINSINDPLGSDDEDILKCDNAGAKELEKELEDDYLLDEEDSYEQTRRVVMSSIRVNEKGEKEINIE